MDKAFNMVTPVIFGFFVGLFIDKQFHTNPGFTVGLTLLGIATGIWSVIKEVYRLK